MTPQQKQAVAANVYRAAKKEAQSKAKIAAKEVYNKVYSELVDAAYVEYAKAVRQKGDTAPIPSTQGVTPENIDVLLDSMEPDEEVYQ